THQLTELPSPLFLIHAVSLYCPRTKVRAPHRHTRESGYPEVFDFPGFRVALATASLPGMTPNYSTDFRNATQGHLYSLSTKPSLMIRSMAELSKNSFTGNSPLPSHFKTV